MNDQCLDLARARIIALLKGKPVDLSRAEKAHEALLVKARRAWNATWLGKRDPLDNKTAEALGRGLDLAASFRETAGSGLSPKTRDLIEQIEGTASKLEDLLAYSAVAYKTAAFRTIEQCLPLSSTLDGARFVLAELCEAAGKAKTRHRHDSLHAILGSPECAFILAAKKVYENYADGKEAGVATFPVHCTLGGPFVRFVQEASRQFCEGVAIPSSDTIKKTLAEERRYKITGVRCAGK